MKKHTRQELGLGAALLTPVLMGLSPIFGRLSLASGIDTYTLSAIRTCLAALLLWGVFALFARRYIYIFPAGLFFTLVVGAVNGFGSLLYYNGLALLDNASLTQLIQMLYVIFAMLFTRFYGQHVSRLSIVRAALALVAVYLLTLGSGAPGPIRIIGVGLMIGSALLYALHVVLSQRVMFEMPAPTMALYALTWMGVTVLAARLVYGQFYTLPWTPALPRGWLFILSLTLVTALSRLTLFVGVRHIGVVQTILLNMAEMGVTLLIAFIVLDERMTLIQWGGVVVLLVSVLLSRWDTQVRDDVYRPLLNPSPLSGLPADVQQELAGLMGTTPGTPEPPEATRQIEPLASYVNGGTKPPV